MKKSFLTAAASLLAMLTAFNSFAQGNVPEMAAARLSPDGNHLAYMMPHQGETSVAIEDLRPGGKITIVPAVEGLDFTWLRWANDKRLVIAMQFPDDADPDEAGQTRLIAADVDGGNIGSIIEAEKRVKTGSRVPSDMAPPTDQDNIVSWLPDDPKNILVSIDANHDDKMEVRMVNVRTGKFKVVQEGLPGVQNWLADQNNEVRLGWGELGNDVIVWYAKPGEGLRRTEGVEWQEIGFKPLAFTDDPNVVFAMGKDSSDRMTIRKLNMISGEFVESVFEQPNADATSLLVDTYSSKPVGVSYQEDAPMQTYFDEEMRVVQRTIDRAVPDAANRIVSTSQDRRQVLVYSQVASNVGEYYFWDRDAKSFELLGEAMQGWAGEFGGAGEDVTFVAREGF